jgi:hypothetical protein
MGRGVLMLSFLYRTFLVVMVGGGAEGAEAEKLRIRRENPEKNRAIDNSRHATTKYEVFRLKTQC